jgi:hypothetical protein
MQLVRRVIGKFLPVPLEHLVRAIRIEGLE